MKKGDCLRSNDDSFGKRGYRTCIYRACNTVFAQRGCTKLVNVSFLWPEDSEEAFMAGLTGYIAALCQKEAVKLGLVTAGVSSFVQKAVISVTAVGYANEDFTDNDGKIKTKHYRQEVHFAWQVMREWQELDCLRLTEKTH